MRTRMHVSVFGCHVWCVGLPNAALWRSATKLTFLLFRSHFRSHRDHSMKGWSSHHIKSGQEWQTSHSIFNMWTTIMSLSISEFVLKNFMCTRNGHQSIFVLPCHIIVTLWWAVKAPFQRLDDRDKHYKLTTNSVEEIYCMEMIGNDLPFA